MDSDAGTDGRTTPSVRPARRVPRAHTWPSTTGDPRPGRGARLRGAVAAPDAAWRCHAHPRAVVASKGTASRRRGRRRRIRHERSPARSSPTAA